MNRVQWCVSSWALACAVTMAFAQTGALPSVSDLAGVTARGRLLYEYDEAAWHASDAVMAMHPPKEDLGHYIAKKTDSGWVVAFGHLNGTRDAFLVAVLSSQGKSAQEYAVRKFDPADRDTVFFLAAAKGIEIATSDFHGSNRAYNAAVLPAAEGQLYVYLVPAPTDSDPNPLGADVRYLVSATGTQIVERRQLHKGIIENGPVPAGTKAAAGFHNHVLSDVPEDTDVFHVLTEKPAIPEYIGTEIAVYAVETDGTIRVVKKLKKHK